MIKGNNKRVDGKTTLVFTLSDDAFHLYQALIQKK